MPSDMSVMQCWAGPMVRTQRSILHRNCLKKLRNLQSGARILGVSTRFHIEGIDIDHDLNSNGKVRKGGH